MKHVIYKKLESFSLAMDVFEPPGTSTPVPAILFFHGGGWQKGSPDQFHPQCRYFASRGLVAMSVQYRVEEIHGTDPRESVRDAKSAIRFLRTNATEFGVDPSRIVAGGGSAGAHVAAAAAMLRAFDDPSDDVSVSARPDCLVLFNPVIDNGPGGYGHERVKEYWRDFSPAHNIDSSAPPAIVLTGDRDTLVPVSVVSRFKKKLDAVGVGCAVRIYPGRPHGFFNYADGTNPWFASTLSEVDRFLSGLGYLKGSPTIEPVEIEIRSL